MIEKYVKEGTYCGEPAIFMKYGSYSAVMLPQIGGNLISFRDDDKQYVILREPTEEEFELFKERPRVYGIPILFPPNRYDQGQFDWNGNSYQFPINEPSTNNHIHGFVYNCLWQVTECGTTDDNSYVTVSLHFDETHPSFVHFPHVFTLRLTYTVSADGLAQQFTCINEGTNALPFMLGFHTAINAPFAPGSSKDDITVQLTIGDRWQLDERMLPTGLTQPLDEGEGNLQNGIGDPYYAAMDNHYSSMPADGQNYMSVMDRKAGVRLVYDVGLKYKHWMVWNNRANGSFFCPEPQTSLVNAPNSSLDPDKHGLFALNPGEQWTETSRIYVEMI